MSDRNRREQIHDLEVTVWVGKRGIDSVVDELDSQLDDRDLVKVKFHRSARAGRDVETLADDLAEQAGAAVVETRGHTAVME